MSIVIFDCGVSAGNLSTSSVMAEIIEKACKICNLCSRMRMKLSTKNSILRRLNSAPSPTVLALGESVGKENAFIVSRSPGKTWKPLEENDSNSQDSACIVDDSSFLSPVSLPSKRNGLFCKSRCSQETESPQSSNRSYSVLSSQSLRSLSFSSDTYDDGLYDLSDLDKPDENFDVLGKLLTGPLISGKEKKETAVTPTSRPMIRRAFSMVENHIDNSRVSESKLSFKRPSELTGNVVKRRKSGSFSDAPKHKLRRSISETVTSVHSSNLSSFFGRSDLIADFSRPYALPFVRGQDPDLTSISVETLSALMRGEFRKEIRSFTIIDCRYPFEFEAGHIRGALNLFTSELIEEELFHGPAPHPAGELGDANGRDVLIFHCEFSRFRGPNLYRWLRRADRNANNYPSLLYPEMYLLQGGYSSFHTANQSLCEPAGYTSMVDPRHASDLKKYRDAYGKLSCSRSNLKRLVKFECNIRT